MTVKEQIDELITKLAETVRPIVRRIESGKEESQDHHTAYVNTISGFARVAWDREEWPRESSEILMTSALLEAGGNQWGVIHAFRLCELDATIAKQLQQMEF